MFLSANCFLSFHEEGEGNESTRLRPGSIRSWTAAAVPCPERFFIVQVYDCLGGIKHASRTIMFFLQR